MNILITGAWQEGKKFTETMENKGHKVFFLQYEKDNLPCEYNQIEGIIGNGIFLHHPIEKFVNLKYIQLTSAGFDRVPMDYVKEHNIKINNARGVYSIPMAEFALAGVLNLYKKMSFFHENQKQHKWEKDRNITELNGKTVLILGCGSVGTECAKRFKAFGCNVIGIDIVKFENNAFDNMYLLDESNNFIPQSDIIVLTLPLTDDTRNLINKDKFNLMKNTAILVNISRGGVVNQKDLEENTDKIGGAVLDVFKAEPLEQNSPLWDKENVIVTPHNSFISENNNDRLTDLILKHLNIN